MSGVPVSSSSALRAPQSRSVSESVEMAHDALLLSTTSDALHTPTLIVSGFVPRRPSTKRRHSVPVVGTPLQDHLIEAVYSGAARSPKISRSSMNTEVCVASVPESSPSFPRNRTIGRPESHWPDESVTVWYVGDGSLVAVMEIPACHVGVSLPSSIWRRMVSVLLWCAETRRTRLPSEHEAAPSVQSTR